MASRALSDQPLSAGEASCAVQGCPPAAWVKVSLLRRRARNLGEVGTREPPRAGPWVDDPQSRTTVGRAAVLQMNDLLAGLLYMGHLPSSYSTMPLSSRNSRATSSGSSCSMSTWLLSCRMVSASRLLETSFRTPSIFGFCSRTSLLTTGAG